MHWFKRHPDFLRVESESLAKDGNYKELFQVRNNLFVSHGTILVRLDKIYRFPVLIVYTDATPFELPVIYILENHLDEGVVKHLSQLSFETLSQQIKPHIRFFHHLRHQNATGALCILEWDNLDDGTQYLGISTILKRVRDWCAGTVTGVFPPDSQEIEFAAHFNDVESNIRFLYPESFLEPNLTCGEAYGQLYTLLPEDENSQEGYRIYMGCLMVGENSSGVVSTIDFNVPGLFTDHGISGPLELYTKTDLLQKKLNGKQWVKCFWFHVATSPAPFTTIEELNSIIGNGDKTKGLMWLHRIVYQGLRLKPDHFFIGLRFPNRQGELEFQLFKIYKNNQDQPTIFNGTAEETITAFVASYTRVSAVECEKLTEETFHLRNSGRANRDKLKDKIVNIIGTGALGSEIADSINKAGPGAIFLFDNQRMKAHNAVRHLAGFNQIGLAKVVAVAHLLRQHNPFVFLEVFTRNINHYPVEDDLTDGSVSVSSIADDNVEAYLNERAVLAGKTVFYARALRGGKAARIFRVMPGKDACFHCLNLYRNDGETFIDIQEDVSLPTLKNECNNPIRPASAADLKMIASITSRLVIDELQNDPDDNNHWIWTTEDLDGPTPLIAWRLHAQQIPPHPRCVYCHHEKHLQVWFNKKTLEKMQDLVKQDPTRETGGVLAGFIKDDGNLEVHCASEPGPKAICTATKFEKDIAFCQGFLDQVYKDTNAVYLGEWHSHPSKNNKPSGTDLKSLSEIAIQPEYLTENPVMVIMSSEGKPSCTIHPANKIYYQVELELIDA